MKGKMCLCFIIVALFLMFDMPIVSGSMSVFRKDRDEYAAILTCGLFVHSSGIPGGCRCDEEYNTVMTPTEKTYSCASPFELECYISLLDSKQTYLVGQNSANDTARIISADSKKTKNFKSISKIFLWNCDSEYVGKWLDVTDLAKPYFSVDTNSSGDGNLTMINLNTTIWQGHLLKLTLKYEQTEMNYEPCLTLKVEGRRRYPFDFNEFKSHFKVDKTTEKPTLVTTTNVTTTNATDPSTKNTTTVVTTVTTVVTTVTTVVTTVTTVVTTPTSTSKSTDLTTQHNTTNTTKTTSPSLTLNWEYYVLGGFSIMCVFAIIVLLFMLQKKRKIESVNFEPEHNTSS